MQETKAKRRVLGTIRFIGELFGRAMLSSVIMKECISILLGDVTNPQEEDIEVHHCIPDRTKPLSVFTHGNILFVYDPLWSEMFTCLISCQSMCVLALSGSV